MSRLISILHLSINVPMQWPAGKTHTLSDHDGSIKFMGRSVDSFYDVMLRLEKDGRNILDKKSMSNIFKPLKIKPLDDYVKYIFDFKKNQLLVKQTKNPWKVNQKVIFHPTREGNKSMSSLVVKLGEEYAA